MNIVKNRVFLLVSVVAIVFLTAIVAKVYADIDDLTEDVFCDVASGSWNSCDINDRQGSLLCFVHSNKMFFEETAYYLGRHEKSPPITFRPV